MNLTHVGPKQEPEEGEREMDWHIHCVYSHHQCVSVYFGHRHLHLLQYLQQNRQEMNKWIINYQDQIDVLYQAQITLHPLI